MQKPSKPQCLKVLSGIAMIESLNYISGMLFGCFSDISITVTLLLLTTSFTQHNLDPVLYLLQASLLCAHIGNKIVGMLQTLIFFLLHSCS